jgi:prepilin-type N-terminal cleavage/methylation domain-containing protein
MRTRRPGFTAVEVIVAVAVLALAVLPVFVSTTSSSKNVRLTEYHVIAQTRAKRLLEAFSTYSLAELKAASGGGGPLPPPFSRAELDGAAFDLPPEYRRKMENFAEEYSFEAMDPDLGMVKVRITWTVESRQLEYELFRFVGAPALSKTVSPPLGAAP